MASFSAAGAAIDQAIDGAKSAQRKAEYDIERGMQESQRYYEMQGVRENLADNNDLIHFMSGEIANLRFAIQELKGEIEAIKMKMNMPVGMGGYSQNAGLPTPPRQASPIADWYESRVDTEGIVI